MEIKVEGHTLTITCPLGSGVPSSTGKSRIMATTNGFVPAGNSDLKVSLNVIKPRSRE